MTDWQKMTAVVTGGASGIGRALSLAMSRRGASVLVTDIDFAGAQKVAAECGNKASAALLDVRQADAVQACIEQYVQAQGHLDFLFNNAGIAVAGETNEIPLAAWRRVIDINVHGVLHGVLAAYPIMLKQGYGHIINTASLAGVGPAPLLAPYALSKHAVVGLSTSLRIEAALKGVKVSVLCPAAIETPILDAENPKDIPIPWAPDMRRFLTTLAGPPYAVEKCAEETLAAIERNVSVIVLPGRARLAWRIGRLFPALVEKISRAAVAKERLDRI
ncbi:MAG: SDR family oxidoreductase [Polaromonas sp.]|nr:SDR family oxidoreductase [Polaromonas sp.]MDP3355257.1 SDR family oxidoreductase [Polaromonas sp.]MDP3751369.1 SDR family oxidoreductase [Polaromonas sp.]